MQVDDDETLLGVVREFVAVSKEEKLDNKITVRSGTSKLL